MLATGPFALPTFREMYASPHAVVGLVTGPIRPQHTPQPVPVNPLRALAAQHGTPIFDPESVNDPASRSRLAQWQADLLVVCDYGQILAIETLATARLGGINLHASLLPKYRGAAPINWALYHGERETGVTVIHMTPQLDAGPCIAQCRQEIGPDETAPQLETRLAEVGAALVQQAIDCLERGAATALPQDPALASRAPRLKKTDGLIDWQRPAEALRNQVRALQPWPKCCTYWRRSQGQPLRLILGPVTASADSAAAPPGSVLEAVGDRLVVAAGQGRLILGSIQPAGKRMLPVAEFLRGYRVQPGDHFSSG
jgi:methionyl-tRNA formyltransferase